LKKKPLPTPLPTPQLQLVPPPLSTTEDAMTISLPDNESVPLGLALTGSNPDDLTITSAVWSVDQDVTIDQTAPALTATAVTTPGTDGTATGTVTATLSDGSTLDASFSIDVTPAPTPLALEVVFGTPVPNA
jgi:hypothetical protein